MAIDGTFEVDVRRWTCDEELTRGAENPDCTNQQECAEALEKRLEQRSQEREKVAEMLLKRRNRLEENPFDARTEVSADALRIVKHLWIIFVVLPAVVGLVWGFLSIVSHSRY